ncbi:hypothetical protein [Ferroacidibacillus organovorans]|uniref:hypothetical protein n=1 Tax=Ferroacidibacillus organovorans TaxID=1765683 RepID=UPI0015C4775D|nr:hypothetical protein [Ferroacidibacillus organovorans]
MGDSNELRAAFTPIKLEEPCQPVHLLSDFNAEKNDPPAELVVRYAFRSLSLIGLFIAVLATSGEGNTYAAILPDLFLLIMDDWRDVRRFRRLSPFTKRFSICGAVNDFL